MLVERALRVVLFRVVVAGRLAAALVHEGALRISVFFNLLSLLLGARLDVLRLLDQLLELLALLTHVWVFGLFGHRSLALLLLARLNHSSL